MSLNLMTFIGRVSDSMLLVVSDNAFDVEYKRYAVSILKSLNSQSPSTLSYKVGDNNCFHYIIDQGVCYICLNQGSYPKKLAFAYLEELSSAFLAEYKDQIFQFSRPYAAVDFDPTMARIKRSYIDASSPTNVTKLNEELGHTYNLMVENISAVLERGERLDKINSRGAKLRQDSERFKKVSKNVRLHAWYRSMAPIAAIVMIILFVFWYRFF